jgi:hypothetical protein
MCFDQSALNQVKKHLIPRCFSIQGTHSTVAQFETGP